VSDKICDVCHKPNTEFLVIEKKIVLTPLLERSNFSLSSWTKRLVNRYLRLLLKDPLDKEIYMCQSCVSKNFK